MPELPEVEAARCLLEKHCVQSTICNVIPSEPFDDIVIGEQVTAKQLTCALLDRTVSAVHRRGKQLWMEFSGNGPCLLLHFGMTGSIFIEGVEPLSYQSFKVDEQFPPRFTKLELRFKKARGKSTSMTRLAYCDPRRLGRLLLRTDPLGSPPLSKLARDPMLEPPTEAAFKESCLALSESSPIKAVLLAQDKLVCGVGNCKRPLLFI